MGQSNQSDHSGFREEVEKLRASLEARRPQEVRDGQASDITIFNEVLAPLEDAANDVLDGPGRVECFVFFTREPDTFRRLVAGALKRGTRNKIGLLVWKVRQRQSALEFPLDDNDLAA